jgi:hypothetical protein
VSNILIDTSQVATDTIDYVAADTWGNTATSTPYSDRADLLLFPIDSVAH